MTKAKYLILFLAVTVLMLVFPNTVNAAATQATETTTTSTGKTVKWSYELDSNNNIIDLKCTNIAEVNGDLAIPSTIDGHTVLTIGNSKNTWDDGAFQGCAGITGVTIPDTVTNIGYRAFFKCSGLKTVTLPDSVTTIGEETFYNCTGLTSVTLPKNLTSMGSEVFYGCTGLASITLPNSLTTMGSHAFYGCTGLKSVTFSNNLSTIENRSFYNCTGLKSISFPNSLTKIGENAFENCTGLSEIVLSDNITTVQNGAFQGCAGLKKVTLSNNITTINNETFKNCSGLTSIIIPESVTTIKGGEYSWEGAFNGCTNLTKIQIPDSVASIEKNAFYNCKKLTIYGNDGQASKSFAEQYKINFKYISQWDEAEAGEDITAPTIENLKIEFSHNFKKDDGTGYYMAAVGTQISIKATFSEVIYGTTAPTLTIKCGNGEAINLSNGVITGQYIVYTYTIKQNDVGIIAATGLTGGDIKDAAGNAVERYNCPTLTTTYLIGEDFVYANGTVSNPENKPTDPEQKPTDPEQKPTDPEQKPTDPEQKPTDPEQKPTDPEQKPANPEQKPADDTAKQPYHNAGLDIGVVLAILLVIISGVVVYSKYNKMRDI